MNLKTTQAAPAQALDQKITPRSRDTGIPASRLKRSESKARALRADRRTLSVTVVIETHVALQKLASQKGRSLDDLVIEILTKAASQVELTSGDFEAMAVEVQAAEAHAAKSSRPTTSKEKTTIEIDAIIIAKLRAMLRAVGTKQTAESFIKKDLSRMIGEPEFIGELFFGLIEDAKGEVLEWRRELNVKLRRILAGDKRLVRPEPMPRNAVVYQHNLERLAAIGANAGAGVNSALNVMLDAAMNEIDRGNWSLVPNVGGAAA